MTSFRSLRLVSTLLQSPSSVSAISTLHGDIRPLDNHVDYMYEASIHDASRGCRRRNRGHPSKRGPYLDDQGCGRLTLHIFKALQSETLYSDQSITYLPPV
jgi:hypothetical protein